MSTLFISDLHLAADTPEIAYACCELLERYAGELESLYILGDLFEAWIGDDAITGAHQPILSAIKKQSSQGVKSYFMHGNRDFLAGEEFARQTAVTLLSDPTTIDLYGIPTLLMHGDLLCTDDLVYQEVRKKLRDPQWQQYALGLSIEERIKLAHQAREQSEQHKGGSGYEIMDANEGTVCKYMEAAHVTRLIHGHTHRPGIHKLSLPHGEAERIVLGDWGKGRSSFLLVSDAGYELVDPRVN
ncbi:MAG: UDP-2,3-diacylglucosamine diphosphatase [Gammaproteobacteria bacterium]|nr:UDP-2,3-diacylglucosamine diphosphatase [Gammaproteobacteria bacterium]